MKVFRLLYGSVLLTLFISSPSHTAPVPDRHIEYPTYFAHANGISIAYQDFGDPADPAIILVMGLGAQLIHWQDEFVMKLVDEGYRVIRFDNRDIGLSEKFYDAGTPGLFTALRYKLGMSLGAPYHLNDMAADGIGLLDHLQIDKAHVAGISMGGMIAQLMTANYPDRILSLTSIMSTTSREGLPEGTISVGSRDRDEMTRDEVLLEIVNASKAIYGLDTPYSDEEWLTKAARGYDRSHYDEGFARQFWAIVDSGDRIKELNSITQPSLVIHGRADPLIPLEHGIDTAENIANSKLVVLDDMGHYMDLPHHDRVLEPMLELMEAASQ
jgi:pimeloyl-ACP methyl ester carboxylesterase